MSISFHISTAKVSLKRMKVRIFHIPPHNSFIKRSYSYLLSIQVELLQLKGMSTA